MLIQLRDFSDDLAERLKRATYKGTASKAVEDVCQSYFYRVDTIAKLEKQVAELKELARVQQQIIDCARESAAALLDHVAQGDLLQQKR